MDTDNQGSHFVSSPKGWLDDELNADRLREECGVFGIYGHPLSLIHI